MEDIKRLEKVIDLTRTFETFEETLKSIGKIEGKIEGKMEEKEETAKKLLEMGDSMEKVREVTNLSQEKLIAIQSTILI